MDGGAILTHFLSRYAGLAFNRETWMIYIYVIYPVIYWFETRPIPTSPSVLTFILQVSNQFLVKVVNWRARLTWTSEGLKIKCDSLGQKKTSPVGRVSKDPQIPHSLALDYNLLTASTRNVVGLVKLQGPIKPSAVPQWWILQSVPICLKH